MTTVLKRNIHQFSSDTFLFSVVKPDMSGTGYVYHVDRTVQ